MIAPLIRAHWTLYKIGQLCQNPNLISAAVIIYVKDIVNSKPKQATPHDLFLDQYLLSAFWCPYLVHQSYIAIFTNIIIYSYLLITKFCYGYYITFTLRIYAIENHYENNTKLLQEFPILNWIMQWFESLRAEFPQPDCSLIIIDLIIIPPNALAT